MKAIGDDYLVMIGKYTKDEKNHYGIGIVMSSYEEMKLLQNLQVHNSIIRLCKV